MLAVFLFHYYNIKTGPIDNAFLQGLARLFQGAGHLGVDFFFTLSGFLITSILISADTFDLGKFYLKRGFRIVPLYLLLVWISYAILPLVSGQELSLPPIGYVLSFTANMFYAYHGDSYLFAVTILWSLSVEMQFYILWGAVLRFFKQYLYLLAVIFIVISIGLKYMMYLKCSMYYISETYVPDFMIGAIGAKLANNGIIQFKNIHKGIKLSLYLAALVAFVCTPTLNAFLWWKIASNCLYSALALCVILDQSSENSLFDIGKSKLISYWGKVSYGIYCFQGFVLPLFSRILLPRFNDSGSVVRVVIIPFVLFAITAILASVSYRFFESYFLRLKERT